MRTRNWGPKGATDVQWVGSRVLPNIQQCTRQSPHNQERCGLSTLTSETFLSPRGGSSKMASGLYPSSSRPLKDAREGVGCIPFSSQKPLVWGASPSDLGVDYDTGAPSEEEGKESPVPGPASSGLHTPSSLFFCPTISPFQNLTLMLLLSAVTSRVWEGGREEAGASQAAGPAPCSSGMLHRAHLPVGPKLRAPSR